MEETLVRKSIYMKALSTLEHWGALQLETYLVGVKDAIRIFLNVDEQKIKSLERKIKARIWSGKEISKEMKKVINLYLEAQNKKEIHKYLKKWLNCEIDLSEIACGIDVFEKTT